MPTFLLHRFIDKRAFGNSLPSSVHCWCDAGDTTPLPFPQWASFTRLILPPQSRNLYSPPCTCYSQHVPRRTLVAGTRLIVLLARGQGWRTEYQQMSHTSVGGRPSRWSLAFLSWLPSPCNWLCHSHSHAPSSRQPSSLGALPSSSWARLLSSLRVGSLHSMASQPIQDVPQASSLPPVCSLSQGIPSTSAAFAFW